MKPVLMAVYMLLPCSSDVAHDPATRTTTVIACPDTFREAAGPFVAEGWKPPAKVSPRQGASPPKYKYKKKKWKKKKRRR